MAKETEYKFLVDVDKLPSYFDYEVGTKQEIEQFYLKGSCGGAVTTRVRVTNQGYGPEAHLTIKGPKDGLTCDEFEYLIPPTDVQELRKYSEGTIISKTRYKVRMFSYILEVDVFHGELEGLMLIEIEVQDGYRHDFPDWFGKDVSCDPRYTNSWMSVNGRPKDEDV